MWLFPTTWKWFGCLAILCIQLVVEQQDLCAQHVDRWEEVGKLPFRYFDTAAFGASPENWDIVQDEQGIIYAGNTEGLLIHDGTFWDLIPVLGGMASGLAVGTEGTLYIGGYKELGYLGANDTGLPHYVSLKGHIPEEFQDFITIWDVVSVGESIYFFAPGYLYRWKNNTMSAWITKGMLSAIALPGSRPIFYNDNQLFELDENDVLKEVRIEGEALSSISGIISDGSNHVLVFTRNGLFRCHSGSGAISSCSRQPTDIDDVLASGSAVDVLLLKEGVIAVNIDGSGVALLDAGFQLLRNIDENSGLLNTEVLGLSVDRVGALWLATRDGITRVEATDGWSSFGWSEGLSSQVSGIIRWNDRLYVSTFVGLYELLPGDGFTLARFEKVGKSDDLRGCYDIAVVGESLIAACLGGLARINSDANGRSWVAQVFLTNYYPWRITVDPLDPSFFYVAGQSEIGRYRLSKNTIEAVHLQRITPRIHRIAQDPASHDQTRLRFWVVSDEAEIYWVDVPREGTNWQERLVLDNFPLDGRVQEFFFLGNSFFTTPQKGLYRFSPSVSGVYDFEKEPVLGDRKALYWGQNDAGTAWVVVDDTVRTLTRETDGTLVLSGHTTSPRIETLREVLHYGEEDGATWFGHVRGVIRISPDGMNIPRETPIVMLREAAVQPADSVIYRGPVQHWSTLELPIEANSIRFEFSAQVYDLPEHVQYRVWLEGYDSGWSNWASEPMKEYARLREGEYTLHIQAKDRVGEVSEMRAYAFTIHPPWYRTYWAYTLWVAAVGLFLGASIWGVNRYQTRRLKARNALLNQLVIKKTEEIRGKNELLSEAYEEMKIINGDLGHSNQALQERTDRLREALEANKEILGITAHDLKNPLGGIIGLAEMVIEDAETDPASAAESVMENITMLKEEAERMLYIVKELLDKHREGERVTLTKEKIILGDIIASVMRWNKNQADDKQIKLHYMAERMSIVEVDVVAIQRALDNYVSNAIKYSPPGSNVWVEVEPDADAYIKISVEDEGPGLTEADKTKVFGKMQRLSATPTGGEHSTGLGLFIVKQLVEAHGGYVGVESEAGKGASFWMTLPTCDIQSLSSDKDLAVRNA